MIVSIVYQGFAEKKKASILEIKMLASFKLEKFIYFFRRKNKNSINRYD